MGRGGNQAASKTIKGLTVEIGGDTTKLGKALKDVEAKSRSLSKELGDINKLLKMDPGNTDLLAQKQRVLAEAVENTRRKLETLKEAERQVQEQFERGEVSEEQFRALQREIVATENRMRGYQRAAQQTADGVDQLGDDSGQAGEQLEETGNEAEKSEKKLLDFGGAVDKAANLSKNLGSTLANATKVGLTAVGAAAGTMVAGMVASAEATREYREEMGKLSVAYGSAGHSAETATKTYKTLQGVIGETDQSVEAAQQIALLARSEEDAAKWAGLAAGVVGRFGDALQPETFFESANETIKLGEATGAYTQLLEGAGYNVDKFNAGLEACGSAQEKQAYMLKITEQLLGEAAGKYRETNAEIIRANEANEAWMSSMAGIGAAIDPILSDIKLLGASLLAEAVPGVNALADAFRGIMNGEDGAVADFGAQMANMITGAVSKITEMLPTLAQVGVSMVSALAGSIVQQLPTLAQTGLSLITTLTTSISQYLPNILSTGGQIVTNILNGIAFNLPNIAQGALNVINGFVLGIQTYLPLVLEKGREILLNLSNGIAQNLPNLVSQALDILMNFANTLYENAPMLIQTGFDVLSNLVTGVMNSLPVLLSKAPEIVSRFANVINDNFPTILAKGVQLIGQIIAGIIQAIPTLVANAPKIIQAIVDVWEAFNWLSLGKKAITLLKDGVLKMVSSVKSAGKSVLNGIVNAIKNLPNSLLNIGRSAMSGLGNAIRSGASAAKSAATSLMNGVVNALRSLPSKVISIGRNLVTGLWNGISDKVGWIVGRIQSFGSRVTSAIKGVFGIHSPSRVFRDEVGAMLAEGLAEGITENEKAPLGAMANLSRGLLDEANGLNGVTLERKLRNTFIAPASVQSVETGMLERLDKILAAIERGHVIVLDSKQLIGATAAGYDSTLGQRRVLVERGAL